MPPGNVNHFVVLAEDLEATRDFCVGVLGPRVGERAPFQFLGGWIYLGERAVVHLAKLQADQDQRDYLGTRKAAEDTGRSRPGR